MRLDLILPLLVVLVGAIGTLVVGIFLPRARQTISAWLAGAVLVTAAVCAGLQLAFLVPQFAFDGSFAADGATAWVQLVVLASALACVVLAVPVFRNDAREAEFYALLLFATLGALVLAGAADVMEMLLGVLLTSVGSYPLVVYRRADRLALEAVLKYYLLGALANLALILGLVLLYALSASTLLSDFGGLAPTNTVAVALALALTLAGLGFKAGYVPTHYWIPDVYQGATVPVAALLSVIPKVAALLAVARLCQALPEQLGWPALTAGLAAVTMTWGNLAAFRQNDIRRLLGYSSISQAGYLLMGVTALTDSPLALAALLYHFVAYAAANIGAFAVLAASGHHTIAAHAGLVRQRPWLVFAMAVCLLSFMGLPPLAGFVGKFALFTAALQAGWVWLVVLALINTVLSLYYYLRVIGPMVLQPPRHEPVGSGQGTVIALLGGGLSLALGLGAYGLLGVGKTLTLLP